MKRATSISEILVEAMKREGADGLVNSDIECGCGIDDLAPCCNPVLEECCLARRVNKGDPNYPDEWWVDPDWDYCYVPIPENVPDKEEE